MATNAARYRLVAGKQVKLLEFGLRRAQGPDGGLSASKYSYIGKIRILFLFINCIALDHMVLIIITYFNDFQLICLDESINSTNVYCFEVFF